MRESKSPLLTASKNISVRFSETDAMGIVWHGNYLKYFEDGRDAFGELYDLDLVKIYQNESYLTPLVNVKLDYKRSLKVGEKAVVETSFIPTAAAKIIFAYKIYNADTRELMTTGETVQVFMKDNQLEIITPAFFEEWKKKWLPA
jgi:acyl-CoA thioester hydrolase